MEYQQRLIKMLIKESNHNFENPFFVATVVDNNDPTFNYRLKVRIDRLHDAVTKNDELPWAAKLDSSFMGMDSSTSLHSVPEVGSKVLVMAISNDPNSLLYMGCLYKKSNTTPSGNDYLNCYGIYDKNGNYIKLDKVQKLLELIWQGKININKITEMNITVNGNVNLNTDGNIIVNPKGNVNLKVSGNTKVESNGTTDIKSIGPVTVESTSGVIVKGAQDGTYNGFSCLNKCILTNALHVTNMAV